jgi:hypothetical protein
MNNFPDLDYLHSILECRDGALFHKVNRGKARAGNIAGNKCNLYRIVRIDKVGYYAHRLVFFMHNGWCPKYIDHINGDKTDNRIENLRTATSEQNGQNAPVNKRNTSGIKGVTLDKRVNHWAARIRYNGKRKGLGYFQTKELAAEFLELARDMVHGDYANHGTFRSI